MSNQHPISPPLSNDGGLRRTIREGSFASNESPFLYPQHTPDTTSDALDIDQSFSYPSVEMDNGMATGAMDQYTTSGLYMPMSQSDFSQINPRDQLHSFPRESQVTGHHFGPGVNAEEMPDGRSALIHESPPQRTRVSRQTRVRKRPNRQKDKKDKKPQYGLKVPLSELTKHLTDVPLLNTEEYVSRPPETRRHEVETKRKGKIPRPMNSFMLYRQAYAERTKRWCAEKNHQLVSKATGESWQLEPTEVKSFFERMAEIERQKHAETYPEYKFTPNKGCSPPKKRKKQGDDDDGWGSDELENDDWSIPSLAAKRPRTISNSFESRPPTPLEPDSSYQSRNCTPLSQGGDRLFAHHHPQANDSSWEVRNPGRPAPDMLSPPDQGHYYQPSIHQSTLGPNIEDVTYRRMNVPGGGTQFDTSGALAGIPGGTHHQLLPSQTMHSRNPVSIDGVQVDPQLLENNGIPMTLSQSDTEHLPPRTLEMWQPFHENQHYTHGSSGMMRSQEADQYHPPTYNPGLTPALDGREMWNDGHVNAGTAEFEDWLNGQTSY